MPPPRGMRPGRVCDVDRLAGRVGGEQLQALPASMRTHGIGACMVEATYEERQGLRRRSVLVLAAAGIEPSHPGVLRGVVDDFARQAQRCSAGDPRQRLRHCVQPRLVAAHARPREHPAARDCRPPVRSRSAPAARSRWRARARAATGAAAAGVAARRHRVDGASANEPCAAIFGTPSISVSACFIAFAAQRRRRGLGDTCLGNRRPTSVHGHRPSVLRLRARCRGCEAVIEAVHRDRGTAAQRGKSRP
jgi:hypothetical protein